MATYALGARRQIPDIRDYVLSLPTSAAPLPAVVEVDPRFIPPVRDQKQLGSCTAFGTTAALWSLYMKEGFHNAFNPSELFQYWNTRSLEGTTGYDSGASVRDAFKAAMKWGMCAEHWWPYSDANPGPFTQKPPQAAYDNASHHLLMQYQGVPQTRDFMKGCLAQGFGFTVGFSCYESIFDPTTAQTGVIPLPKAGERVIGGHCVWVFKADDHRQTYRFLQSWGTGWGQAGEGEIPYTYLENPNLAWDFWTPRLQQ